MISKHLVSYAVRSTHVSRYFFYKFWSFICTFAIAPTNNVALIKHRHLYHLMPCVLHVLSQLHLAWLQSMQLFCATSCAQKSGVPSALEIFFKLLERELKSEQYFCFTLPMSYLFHQHKLLFLEKELLV